MHSYSWLYPASTETNRKAPFNSTTEKHFLEKKHKKTVARKNKLATLIKLFQETEVNSVKAAGEQQLITSP